MTLSSKFIAVRASLQTNSELRQELRLVSEQRDWLADQLEPSGGAACHAEPTEGGAGLSPAPQRPQGEATRLSLGARIFLSVVPAIGLILVLLDIFGIYDLGSGPA